MSDKHDDNLEPETQFIQPGIDASGYDDVVPYEDSADDANGFRHDSIVPWISKTSRQ